MPKEEEFISQQQGQGNQGKNMINMFHIDFDGLMEEMIVKS